MSAESIDQYDKVHVWVGTNFSPEDEYLKYFELDYSVDIDDPSYRVCGFCKDIGITWYDEDFIGIMPRKEKEVGIDEILVDSAVDRDLLPEVKSQCLRLGLSKANAIFWYSDGSVEVPDSENLEYNGLKYVGLYEGES
ncbi:immunity 22 family protein [Pseudomonas entomophila]|uniref:immunity 22 family protein n=1 Tax=Pseudomonas entomophila TaxID=312306 RepID=UPI0015E316A2|nr:immunity 22 family protein [Pseudomonas entomophila]MBA1190303.1 immunity 22 family protein [Pseudomonas entomophila]